MECNGESWRSVMWSPPRGKVGLFSADLKIYADTWKSGHVKEWEIQTAGKWQAPPSRSLATSGTPEEALAQFKSRKASTVKKTYKNHALWCVGAKKIFKFLIQIRTKDVMHSFPSSKVFPFAYSSRFDRWQYAVSVFHFITWIMFYYLLCFLFELFIIIIKYGLLLYHELLNQPSRATGAISIIIIII